jgi:hypothetical protein
MASAHSLQGLMKWLGRDEWHDAFEDTLDRHLLPACETAGIEVEEVISILDRNQYMMTVWGCAFEDFLTRELDDGRNIVEDYLKRRGWKENASTRSYISALRTSVISLYEVSNIVPDTSFLVRDLVRGGDPILVSERSATRSLTQWDRIAARVLRVGTQTIIAGGVLPFDRDASEELLKVLRGTRQTRTEGAPQACGTRWLRSLRSKSDRSDFRNRDPPACSTGVYDCLAQRRSGTHHKSANS